MTVNLPKDSDPGYARRIAQVVVKEFGALATSPSWHINTGAYGHAVIG